MTVSQSVHSPRSPRKVQKRGIDKSQIFSDLPTDEEDIVRQKLKKKKVVLKKIKEWGNDAVNEFKENFDHDYERAVAEDASEPQSPLSRENLKLNKLLNPLQGNTDVNGSDYIPNPESDFRQKVEKYSSSFEKSINYQPLTPLNESLTKNKEAVIFDLNARPRRGPPCRPVFSPKAPKKPYRIPFKNCLETVIEQSDGFSYLFPEEE